MFRTCKTLMTKYSKWFQSVILVLHLLWLYNRFHIYVFLELYMLKMKISWNSILTHGVGNPHTYFQFYNILKSRSRACSWLFSDILFYIYFISYKCTKTPKFVTHMYLLHIENDSLQNDFSLGLSNKDTAMKHKLKNKF